MCEQILPAVAAVPAVKVKVFIGAMFEIALDSGAGDAAVASEFQHWRERYWQDVPPIAVRGAPHPLYCNRDGICGAVLGMGKIRSATSMLAILLDPRFDFSEAYFLITGAAGAAPSKATVGSVIWGTWLVDYDLGHRWAAADGVPGEPTFMPCHGFGTTSALRLNPALVDWALALSADTPLKDSAATRAYRARYPQPAARGAPFVGAGTHVTGDCFFHGPVLSAEAQDIARHCGADDYVATEMEGIAVAHAIRSLHGIDRVMSLRVAANFDQPPPGETTVQHLLLALEHTTAGLADSIDNEQRVGERVVDHIAANWPVWQKGVPPRR